MAQMPQTPYISWEDFVQEYLEENAADNEQALDEEQLEALENMAAKPLQINRANKDELLQLPFLSETQIDSLLSYRDKKRGFLSLGEIQLVRGMDYFTRRYLSLFVRCDSAVPPSSGLLARMAENNRVWPKLAKGKHTVETRLDVPLYKRTGYETPDTPTATNFYTGNSLHHIVRYRYNYKREASYGLTFEKDAGEPVAKQGFYPYDYISGFVLLRPRGKRWSFVVGDYNLQNSRGLVFGKQQFGGKEMLLQNNSTPFASFRAHTSAEENDFFRGAAGSLRFGEFTLTAFASFRKIDARFKTGTDTAQTLLHTGLHRTISEIAARRTLGCLTGGAFVGFQRKRWGASLGGYYAHYNHWVCPAQRSYNAYYFRGRNTAAVSASYFVTLRKWRIAGEAAADNKMNMATEHAVRFIPSRRWQGFAQIRLLAPGFNSPYGNAVQQGSRTSNEQGILIGSRIQPLPKWELTAYVDAFRFPKPTYTAYRGGTNGVECSVQSICSFDNAWRILVRYRMKSKQQTFTQNSQKGLEYRTTHKLRLAAIITQTRYDMTAQLDGAYYSCQTGKHSLGYMASVRAAWKPSARFNVKGFAAVFFTDDYYSRLYAYEPQLLHANSFPTFMYHGFRTVALANWTVCKPLTISLRYGTTHYFNQKSISSRLDRIASSWKNDVSIQARLTI